MAGIYVHIPFCKSRCIYCDFFSTLLLNKEDVYISALIREINRRKKYLNDEPVNTIYIGGGTPSVLKTKSIKTILNCIQSSFTVSNNAEITIEANPGDLDLQKLQDLREIGINRLSIGIQSFDDNCLRLIGRRHTSGEAIEAVRLAQQAEFENISIDLMYALPLQTLEQWRHTVDTAISLNVQHVSAYCLTIEDTTPIYSLIKQGKIQPSDEDTANIMYETCADQLQQAGFIHYEVSNFCKPDFQSRHNSNYWNNTAYLGIGAAAHSYNLTSRQWNVCDIDKYIKSAPPTIEHLSKQDIYNERMMLGLRTKDGVDLTKLSPSEQQYCLGQAKQYIRQNMLRVSDNRLSVSSIKASELLNRIIIDLMKID